MTPGGFHHGDPQAEWYFKKMNLVLVSEELKHRDSNKLHKEAGETDDEETSSRDGGEFHEL